MNIIRVKLPDRIARFRPFTVEEYRDLMLVRVEMKSLPEEKEQILDGLLEELYPEYTKLEREYIFANVLMDSMGKTAIPAKFKCPCCGKEINIMLRLKQPPLEKPTLQIDNIKFNFKFPESIKEPDEMFLENIVSIEDDGVVYDWQAVQEYHDQLIEMITYEDFEILSNRFQSIKFEQKLFCCKEHTLKFTRLLELFEVLINPDDIFNFYRINRVLVKHDYSLQDVMSMLPIERSIALSMVEKELKDANKRQKQSQQGI